MEVMRLCCSVLFAVTAVAFQAPRPVDPGGVEGRVLDPSSNQPIAAARVTLTPIPIVMGIRPTGGPMNDSFYDSTQMPATRTGKAPPTVLLTDSDGVFRAPLTPGRYQVRAERQGYVPVPAGLTVFSLIPGEKLKGVVLKLNPQSAISGRAVDGEGKLLAGIRVQSLKWTVWGNQRRLLIPQQSASTDERGEYRFAGMTPGQYVLSAATPPDAAASPGRTWVTLFSPGVADLAKARALDLTPGTNLTGVDFRLAPVPVYAVSGKVNASADGLLVTLAPRDPSLQLASNRQYAAAVGADGTFVLPDVPAGAYVLTALANDPQRKFTGNRQVDVVDQSVTDLTVTIEPGVTIRGQVRVSGEPPLDPQPNLPTIFFEGQTPVFSGGLPAQTDPQGRFTIGPLDRDRYRISAQGLPQGYYLKSVQMGGVSSADTLDLTKTSGDVIVTIEEGMAEVNGKVFEKGEKPLGDVPVYAVNARGDVVRSAITVIDGQYRLNELPPGEYRIFPVIDADISDPRVLDRLTAAAVKVTLAPGDRETRHLIVR